MGAYNFKSQFVPFIQEWSKRHTIRGERKNADSIGSVLHLFQGMRHPGCVCLMRTLCISTEFIVIDGGPNRTHQIRMGMSLVQNGFEDLRTYGSRHGGPLVTLSEDELNTLAWRDGFRPEGSTLTTPGDSFRLMMQFWNGRLPFEGQIIHWNPEFQYSKTTGRLFRIQSKHPLFVKGAAA